MDLATMWKKLARGEYRNTQAVRDDLELMARNALVFNAPVRGFSHEAH